MLSHHAHVKDGGTSVDGVTRAALNKMVGLYFREGMRKPARNGNPGELDLGQCKLSRHFLRARWRDPDDPEDCMMLHQMMTTMQQHEVERCIAVLREFTKWRPGPAGRGGDRAMRATMEAHARDPIPRNVRQRIEPSLSAQADDEEDDDAADDTMSMRSTIAAGQRSESSRQKMQPDTPTAPADRVSELQMLLDHIRRKNAATVEPTTAGMVLTPPVGIDPSATTSASASHVSMAENLSSAQLLDILYRRIAAQQTAPQAAQRCATSPSLTTATPMTSMPCVSAAATTFAGLADSTPAPLVPCTSSSLRHGTMAAPAALGSLACHGGHVQSTTAGRQAGVVTGEGHLPAPGNFGPGFGPILPPLKDVLCGRTLARDDTNNNAVLVGSSYL